MDAPAEEKQTQMARPAGPGTPSPGQFEEHKFFPSGAIAFFIFLVILALVFWYGIYILMIERT